MNNTEVIRTTIARIPAKIHKEEANSWFVLTDGEREIMKFPAREFPEPPQIGRWVCLHTYIEERKEYNKKSNFVKIQKIRRTDIENITADMVMTWINNCPNTDGAAQRLRGEKGSRHET